MEIRRRQAQQLRLIDAFSTPGAYAASGSEATSELAARGATAQVANGIEEFVIGGLRNNLLGRPLDLATVDLARGRGTGVAPLNAVRAEFFAGTGDEDRKPYANWAEFGDHIKHPESLVNFIAAYGVHPLLAGAATVEAKRAAAMTIVFGSTDDPGTPLDETVAPDREFLDGTGRFVGVETGLNKVDFWIGGLAENALASGGLLGSTFNFVFETQMENLQNGDRFYYLSRLEGTNFLNQLEGTSFSELVMRNPSRRICRSMSSLSRPYDRGRQSATFPADAEGNPLVTSTGPGMVQFSEPMRSSSAAGQPDTIVAGGGDDTIWGDGGDDQLDGGAGDDAMIGGDGNDRIQGGDGDDFANGAAGDDRISGGEGSDLLVALEGRDTVFGGGGDDEVFGGLGDDAIDGGAGDDVLLGNAGHDTLTGGEGDDHLTGNNGQSLIDVAPATDVAVFSSAFASDTIPQNLECPFL